MFFNATPFGFNFDGLGEGTERAKDSPLYANLDPKLRSEAEAGAYTTLFGALAASAAMAELEEQGKTNNMYARLAELSIDYVGEVANLMMDEDVNPEVDARFIIAVGKVISASLAALEKALES